MNVPFYIVVLTTLAIFVIARTMFIWIVPLLWNALFGFAAIKTLLFLLFATSITTIIYFRPANSVRLLWVWGVTACLYYIISFATRTPTVESFQWNATSTNDFIKLQHSISPNKIYDSAVLQNTVSQADLDYYMNTGKWGWSQATQQLYIDALNKNPHIRTLASDGLNYAMTVYPEPTILSMMGHQTKEGQLLLNGALVPSATEMDEMDEMDGKGDFMYSSGLTPDLRKDVVKCNSDSNTSPPFLERVAYIGRGWLFGEKKYKSVPVATTDAERMIPGFTFLDEPCDPCAALAGQYNCPFQFKMKNDEQVSGVWKSLWGLTGMQAE